MVFMLLLLLPLATSSVATGQLGTCFHGYHGSGMAFQVIVANVNQGCLSSYFNAHCHSNNSVFVLGSYFHLHVTSGVLGY